MRRPKRHLAARTQSTRCPDSPAGRSPAYADARLAGCATRAGCAPPGLASLAPRCRHALGPVSAVMNRAPSDSRVLRTACGTSSPALRRCPSAIAIDGTYLSLCQRQTWLRRRSPCLSTVSRVCRGYPSCRYGHVCGQEHDRSSRSLVTKVPSLRWLDPASCLLSAEPCCLAHRPAYEDDRVG